MEQSESGGGGGPLVKKDQGPVVNVGEGADLHKHDLRPPVVVLGQDQSTDVVAGKFKRMDTGEEMDQLLVVPLIVRPTRTKWPPGGFNRDSVPECWSANGLRGAEGGKYVGTECVGCEHYVAKPWEDGADDRCMPGYNVMLLDAESYEPYIIRLRGSAAKLSRLFSAKGVFQRAVVRVFAEATETPKGKWYLMKAKTAELLEEADQELVTLQYADYKVVEMGQENQESDEEEVPDAGDAAAAAKTPAAAGVAAGSGGGSDGDPGQQEDLPF